MKKNLKIEYVAIDKLKPFAGNPRKNDQSVDAIVKSIGAFGYTSPILVRRQNNEIIAGHTRLKALQKLGAKEAPVIYLDLDETDARTYAIFDNKSVELADWDLPKLADLFVDLDQLDVDLDLTGFTADEIDLIAPSTFEPQAEEDAIPEAPEPISKTGDLWLLGEHRLLCGDATKKEDVERLMGGKKADMVFTDPPFPNNSGILRGMVVGIERAFNNARTVCVGDMFWFWDNISEPPFGEMLVARHVWHKTNGWQANHWEAINLYDGTKKRKESLVYSEANVGGENIREKQGNHPTPKPVSLCEKFVEKASNILDTFLGSGTTLIACEKLGRVCYGMEIEPRYVDVAVKRWEEYTGKKAELDTGGKISRKSKRRPTRANVSVVGPK